MGGGGKGKGGRGKYAVSPGEEEGGTSMFDPSNQPAAVCSPYTVYITLCHGICH